MNYGDAQKYTENNREKTEIRTLSTVFNSNSLQAYPTPDFINVFDPRLFQIIRAMMLTSDNL